MHNAGMAVQLTIRSVPDDVRDELAARAARAGKSLQAYLLGELETLARRTSVADWLAQVRQRKAGRGGISRSDLLGFRDADRR